MTDRELAGCALSEVLALLEKATQGEWRWSMNGNIVPQEYTQDCEIAAVYTEHDELNTEPANSAAICAAVNFLRQHGPTLLAALSTPSSEGDGRDAERLLYLVKEGGVEGFRHVKADIYDYACDAAEESGRDEPNDADILSGMRRLIDAAIAAAAGGS